MKVTLHGIKHLDFKTNENSTIKGTQLFISYEDEGIIGRRTDKLFLKDGFPIPSVEPGNVLEVTFNRHGKPENIRVIPSKQINLSSQ